MSVHTETTDAEAAIMLDMLRRDHEKIQQLFDKFGETTTCSEKRDIVTAAIAALEIHTQLEEELLYPVWRRNIHDQDLMDEACEDHYIVHLLTKELKNMSPEDKRFDVKFSILSETVKHHIEEEEGKMFPQAQKADWAWEELTTQVIRRRQSLEQKYGQVLGE